MLGGILCFFLQRSRDNGLLWGDSCFDVLGGNFVDSFDKK